MEKKDNLVLFANQDQDAELQREVRLAQTETGRRLAVRLEQLTGREYDVEVLVRVTLRDSPRQSVHRVTEKTRYDWPPEKSVVVLDEPAPLSVVFEALKLLDMPRNARDVIQVLYATENEPLTEGEVSEIGRSRAVLDEIRQFLRQARMPFTIAKVRIRKSRHYRLFLLKPPESS